MPMQAEEIEQLIRSAFPDATIKLVDMAGDGDHYDLTVTSSHFLGKSRVEQHKMVYAALKGNMGGVLHALKLTTQSPS